MCLVDDLGDVDRLSDRADRVRFTMSNIARLHAN